ncbi:MAG: thymidine phosphorylase [Armatimonadetes bacterium]|nr:thymidine phosphorylase [Armatimonadota bacterium]
MDAIELIARRRDGKRQSKEELRAIAFGAASGSIPDYQLAAWLMAAYLNPLTDDETADLTVAMAESGALLDLSRLPQPTLDKHSTGGVGDKTTIVLLPLLTACGVTMVKMSGPGLGITGGTVDKLQSIPGFRMDLSTHEMEQQAARIGIAITGQTPDLAPADKALYALRDVTATVGSVPLIVSSILCKKLAGGSKNVVIDLKCGCGGFMPDLEHARELALALMATSGRIGLNLRIAITDMDQPLGVAAGNALEVKEAIATLRGVGPPRFAEHCLTLASLGLMAVGKASSDEEGRRIADEAIRSGRALQKAQEWVLAQGGDGRIFADEDWLRAPIRAVVPVNGEAGAVARVSARIVGQAVVDLGGGRKRKGDSIDPRVGIRTLIEVGSRVAPGQPLFEVHAADEASAREAADALREAVFVGQGPVGPVHPLLEVIGG